jgi:hypothetical protein
MANGDEQVVAVDPRAEARARLADRYDVRVLQPSPPAVGDGPWFADDPVRAPVASGRPTVSPVANGDVTWDELAADDPALADWCADRWLGAWRPLAPIGDPVAFAGTPDALHAVAEEVVSPAPERATGKNGLRSTPRG